MKKEMLGRICIASDDIWYEQVLRIEGFGRQNVVQIEECISLMMIYNINKLWKVKSLVDKRLCDDRSRRLLKGFKLHFGAPWHVRLFCNRILRLCLKGCLGLGRLTAPATFSQVVQTPPFSPPFSLQTVVISVLNKIILLFKATLSNTPALWQRSKIWVWNGQSGHHEHQPTH